MNTILGYFSSLRPQICVYFDVKHTFWRMIVPNVVPRPPALLKQNTFHYAYCTVYGVNTFH